MTPYDPGERHLELDEPRPPVAVQLTGSRVEVQPEVRYSSLTSYSFLPPSPSDADVVAVASVTIATASPDRTFAEINQYLKVVQVQLKLIKYIQEF